MDTPFGQPRPKMSSALNKKLVQADLFGALPDFADIPGRGDQESMQRPMFSLSKSKRVKPIDYRSPDGALYVYVTAPPEYGIASIYDQDLMFFFTSVVRQQKQHGRNDISPKIQFHPADALKFLGRDTGGRAYVGLASALTRLRSTSIKTNIRVGDKQREANFGWIDAWYNVEDHKTGRSLGMEVHLSKWFFDLICDEKNLLSVNPDYFSLTGGIERRLYQIGRKHAGGHGKSGWSISLKTLFPKTGATGTERMFNHRLKHIVAANNLPDVHLELAGPQGLEKLKFVMRKFVDDPDAKPRKPRTKPAPATWPMGKPSKFAKDDVDPDVIAEIRSLYKGWDLDVLKQRFDQFIKANPKEMPVNYSERFKGFVAKHHEMEAGNQGFL